MNDTPPETLELREDVLVNPNRFDLAQIEAAMLFPDDAASRTKVFESAAVEYAAENVDSMGKNELAVAFNRSRTAFPIYHAQSIAADRFIKGAIVGSFLRAQICCVLDNVEDENPTDSIIENVIKPFIKTKNGGFIRISKGHFNNEIWRCFRPVAHFWAASQEIAIHGNPPYFFPCHMDKLKDFLESAESFRLMGERFRRKQAPGPILSSKETMRLPHWFQIDTHFLDQLGK